MSTLNAVLNQLQQERSRLASQIEALGRAISTLGGTTGQKRTMSAAGRARIAAAQRARWAKAKGTVVSINTGGKRKMSATAKARWAKWRKQQKSKG